MSAVHEITSYSPSQMLFGRDLRLPADLLFSRPPDAPLAPEEYIEKLQARMEEMHHLARERIGMASEKMKARYDAKATGHGFHEGDKVWLWNPKRRKGLSPKLQTNWEGPYTVLNRLNDVVVRIQKSPHSKPKAWVRLVGRWNQGGVANVLRQGGKFSTFFGMTESLEAALWLDAW
ncbi:retrovirus-related Pol polyprotein from transposon 412 [Trichonephila clavipes]|nr:retrovirus-related Pol polyprotein from transposon 412 [Trichonephila clavipes]